MVQVKKEKQRQHGASKKQAEKSIPGKQKHIVPLFVIVLVSFIAFLPVLHNGFVNLDDDKYIQNNPMLSSLNLKEIFSRFFDGNYHPFTMLVYAIEFHLWGLNATGYHTINLLLHLLNVMLVFYVVFRISDQKEIAFLASLLFGIHPMHVESVAWASELKDLLYAFFFLASYAFYLRFLIEQKTKFYYYCLLLFLFSLFSKAMAVSLPVVLLLTDYFKGRKMNAKIFIEKIPFFVMSLFFGVLAIVAQKSTGAIQHLDFFSFPQRIVFACYGFIMYLLKLFIPLQLSAYYPYPVKSGAGIPGGYYVFPVLLLGLMAFVFYSLRSSKKIFFSVGFFTVTVFIVLQLLPVGNVIMADRYCYIPSIGIFYLAGEGFYRLWTKKTSAFNPKLAVRVLVGILGIFFLISTYTRSKVWENSLSLWNDVIGNYQTIPIAYNNRGMALEAGNKMDEALADYTKTIELQPDFALPYNNRGNILMNRQKNELALLDYNKAIELDPGLSQPYNGRGVLLMREKKFDLAVTDYRKAIQLKPNYPEVYYNLALCEFNSGKKEDACRDMQKAASLGIQQANEMLNQYCR